MSNRAGLVKAFRRATSTHVALLCLMTILSAYMLQRRATFNTHRLTDSVVTIVLPLALGALALGGRKTCRRFHAIGRILSGDVRGASADELRALTALELPGSAFLSTSGTALFRLIAILGISALLRLLVSGVSQVMLLTRHQYRFLGAQDPLTVCVGVGLLTITTAVGLYWTVPLARILWASGGPPAAPPRSPAGPVAEKAGELAPDDKPVAGGDLAGSRSAPTESWQVFLSAKKLDLEGRPTRDSVLAEQLYEFLVRRGLKVFLSTRSLEKMGAAAYKVAIDSALDRCSVLIAIGTSVENLTSGWVRYEWDSFFNDIISGVKEAGRVFVYVEDVKPSQLPRSLRQMEVFGNSPDERERLFRFLAGDASAVGVIPSLPTKTEEARKGRTRGGLLARVLLAGVVLLTMGSLSYPLLRMYQTKRIASFLGDPLRSGGDLSGGSEATGEWHFDTAWIFLGYLEQESPIFIEGPYATVVDRATGPERGRIPPLLGDVLEILTERQLVIADYRTRGGSNEYRSPALIHSPLIPDDYTGRTVRHGELVIVRDVEVSGVPGRPMSVWCRVAPCDKETESRVRAIQRANH